MTKDFEERVKREGYVDTKKYRYKYTVKADETYIERIERSALGTTAALEPWEHVKEIWHVNPLEE